MTTEEKDRQIEALQKKVERLNQTYAKYWKITGISVEAFVKLEEENQWHTKGVQEFARKIDENKALSEKLKALEEENARLIAFMGTTDPITVYEVALKGETKLKDQVAVLSAELEVCRNLLRSAGVYANHQDCDSSMCSPCDFIELARKATSGEASELGRKVLAENQKMKEALKKVDKFFSELDPEKDTSYSISGLIDAVQATTEALDNLGGKGE